MPTRPVMTIRERTKPRRRLSDVPLRRRIVVIGVLLALPFLLLGAIEGGLRLAGFGGYPPTFVEVGTLDDGSMLVMSDPAGPASYFFSGRSQGLALDPVAFRVPKPESTFRIVWVGGSAAKGIPQPRPLRASAFLEAMLGDLCPDRDVEVINLGVPGIAAYPVLGVLTDALRYEPDLVVVYSGNNEYYGAFGVASLHTAGRSPSVIRATRFIRSTAIAQALDSVLSGRVVKRPESLMEAMVGQASIAPDDPMRTAAARNLETFIAGMINRCRAHGVPVIVCTLPANESGMAPLGKDDLSTLTAQQQQRVADLLAEGKDLLADDPARAEAAFREILGIDPDHALAHHLLGRALRAQERYDEAGAEFRLAVDLDPMPWRSPTSSSEAVRRAAETHGAVLADLDRAFHESGEHGLVGWNLVEDHVHPSLRGQELAARTVLRAMTRLDDPIAPDPDAVAALPGWEIYADRLGRNPYDRYGVACSMQRLGTVSFFARNNPDMSAKALEVRREIEFGQSPVVVRELRRWADPKTAMVDAVPITGLVADALLGIGRYPDAERLYRVAGESSTPYTARRLAFGYHGLVCRLRMFGALSDEDVRTVRALIRRGEFIIRSGRGDAGHTERFVGLLHQLLGEHEQAIPLLRSARRKLSGHEAVAVDEALVFALVQTGRGDEARAIVEGGLSGADADTYRAMLGYLR